jgi:uncharacterized protein (DUF1684 family)
MTRRVTGLASAALALAGVVAAQDSAYRAELERWRRDRETELRAEDGWLAVSGLHWLKEGENAFGSAPGAEIVLPDRSLPARAGALVLRGESLSVRLEPGVAGSLAGRPVVTTPLRAETDRLRVGRLDLQVIRRGGRLGLRVRDPEAPARREFAGLSHFPVDERLRVVARFLPQATPRTIPIPNVLGTVNDMPTPGDAVFHLAGREYRLSPVLEAADAQELFFIFRDRTSGRQTYGGGRFLYTDLPRDGRVVLDFNRAVNPPCAFTAFATCPLPPPQNRLDVAVEAGEKTYGRH